jgi:hypothetical protein
MKKMWGESSTRPGIVGQHRSRHLLRTPEKYGREESRVNSGAKGLGERLLVERETEEERAEIHQAIKIDGGS